MARRPTAEECRIILFNPPPPIPSESWVEFNFLLIVAGLVLLNLLLRAD